MELAEQTSFEQSLLLRTPGVPRFVLCLVFVCSSSYLTHWGTQCSLVVSSFLLCVSLFIRLGLVPVRDALDIS